MTAGFKFFKSTDSGAPTLNNAVSSFIGVLDWALDISDPVNGWQKVYTGTNKAAYRPRAGLRYYVRFEEAAAGVSVLTRGYESMTDVDTGVDPFPLITKFALANFGITKVATSTATARAYWGIKTARYFLIVISGGAAATGENYSYAFGELPTIHTGENYPFIVSGNGNSPGLVGTDGPGLVGIASCTLLGGDTVYNVGTTYSANPTWARNPSGAIKAVMGSVVVSGLTQYGITEGSRVALRRADICYSNAQTAPNLTTGVLTPRSYIPHLWTTNAGLNGAGWAVGDVFAMPDYNAGASFTYLGSQKGCNIILETTDTAGSM
jgi:hypothetical protein